MEKAQHTCQAAVLHCIDFRIQKFLNDYLEEWFPGGCDRIAVAGGVKNLPLEQLEVSIRLHQPKIIILIQHEDCGAYGGSREFKDLETEQVFQTKELQKAEEVLISTFPGVTGKKLFILLSGELVYL